MNFEDIFLLIIFSRNEIAISIKITTDKFQHFKVYQRIFMSVQLRASLYQNKKTAKNRCKPNNKENILVQDSTYSYRSEVNCQNVEQPEVI